LHPAALKNTAEEEEEDKHGSKEEEVKETGLL
jgi:hypothetical protein